MIVKPDLAFWPISQMLLKAILDDNLSDRFVAERVWERLGYRPSELGNDLWVACENTTKEWIEHFPSPPQIIADRKASVHLTRSIKKQYKQLLKDQMKFHGYKIGELYPRRTRRATAVNWLLAWLAENKLELPIEGPIPDLIPIPLDPIKGHPGDLKVH